MTDTSAVNHLVVQTDDLDATIADLAARRVPAERQAEPGPGLRTAWLTDPDGYRIELVQWPAGHADGIYGRRHGRRVIRCPNNRTRVLTQSSSSRHRHRDHAQ